ncbi:MAG: hypothetical protein NVS4B2_24760 [Chloroflexota bacterium]
MDRRLAVLRAGALGDIVLTLPALRILRTRFPDHRIDAIGYPGTWAVATPFVDRIFSIDSPAFAPLFSSPPSLEPSGWFENVDLLVAWTARDLAVPTVRVPVVYASPYPPPGVHAAAWLARSVMDARVRPEDMPPPSLALSETEKEEARAALRPIGLHRPVVIHPGAGAAWKRWPAACFARLVDALRDHGLPVALVEGPADAAVVAEVQEQTRDTAPVIRHANPRVLAAVLAAGRVVVGNDSGVTHLAAAAGAVVVALFGPTDPASWAPLGDARVIRVCMARTRAPGQIRVCEDPECMARIPLEDVLDAVREIDRERASWHDAHL